jgi:SWI/SNF-related matrix-associated actin-dependent regulator of chromatin subfamily B member 1
MRHTAIDTKTQMPTSVPGPTPDNPNPTVPAHVKYMFLPRIRCKDCPGKLYTPGPGMGVENFEVHLRNRAHREKVDRRIRGSS